VVAGEKEVLLEVGGFGVDRGVEMTMIQAYMNVQKSDLGGGGIPSEFDAYSYFCFNRKKNSFYPTGTPLILISDDSSFPCSLITSSIARKTSSLWLLHTQ
jgi:hypothetical protein